LLRIKRPVIVLAAILGFCLGCAEKEEVSGLAKVGDNVITEEDLEARLEGMPPFMRQQLSTPEGRKRFLQGLVEEEIIVRDAVARGFDKTEEFKTEIERRKRDLLVRLFYEKVIEAASVPADSEVVRYYESNPDQFVVPEYLRARHILVETEKEARKLRGQLEDGADFSELALEHSLDPQTKSRDGVLHGQIQRGAPVRGLGDFPEFVEACFQLEPGELSQPIRTELGYHIVRVDEKQEATPRPLDDVRSDIVARLSEERRDSVRDTILNELKDKYKVVFLSETQAGRRTPEALFKLASEEASAKQKIKYYEEFIATYPDNERAYEAKFMIGFTLAEDLQDYDEAGRVFNQFLEQYPESDLSDDARWMLENMRSGEEPDFGS
jgi:peptidyl-prolyl cis-trans isomerase C